MENKMYNIKKCLRCNYEWDARVKKPRQCPYCKSPYWNIARKVR